MKISLNCRRSLLTGSAILALTLAAAATPAHAVVPGERTDSEEIVDDEGVFDGVGIIVTIMLIPQTLAYALTCDWQVGFANSKSTNLVLVFGPELGSIRTSPCLELVDSQAYCDTFL